MTVTEVKVDRRKGSREAIQRLVEHRTEMLALYGELASHRPFEKSDSLLMLIQRYCQALVDYTADAHFRLYRYIEANTERRTRVLEVADRVYPTIANATQVILDFNDKYDTPEHCSDLLNQLEKDLSSLGELLADRIELEDQLIEVLT